MAQACSTSQSNNPDVTIVLINKDLSNDAFENIEPPKFDYSIVDYNNNLQTILMKIVELSKTWTTKNIQEVDLIVRTEAEYTTLMQFRKLSKLNNDILSKKIIDELITHESGLFETRNAQKQPTISTTIEKTKSHKKFKLFGKNKKSE